MDLLLVLLFKLPPLITLFDLSFFFLIWSDNIPGSKGLREFFHIFSLSSNSPFPLPIFIS